MGFGRTKLFTMKLAPAEYSQWQLAAQARGVTVANLVRAHMVMKASKSTPKVRRLAAPNADPALLAGIARIGNNLNQLGR